MASGPITSWQIEGVKMEVVPDFLFLGSKITADGDCSYEIRRWLLLGRKAVTNQLKQSVEKQRHHSANRDPYSQGNGLPRGRVQVRELDCKEGREPKNRYLQTVVLEKIPKYPFHRKEIKLVNLKRNPPWILIGKTDAEVEAPVFWSSDANSQLVRKVSDARKDWGQEEKGTTEDEMAGWHHWLNGHEFGRTLGVGDRQGGLACCSSWGGKGSDITEWLNWIEL